MTALVSIRIDLSADVPPVLDPPAAARIIDGWADEVLDSFGRQGLSQVHMLMDAAFRNPTPYYETQVIVDRAGDDVVIHDRGVIYGPWLEGVGSRNATTRFKGYTHWRRTGQWLAEEEGPRIVDRHTPTLVARLEGGGVL